MDEQQNSCCTKKLEKIEEHTYYHSAPLKKFDFIYIFSISTILLTLACHFFLPTAPLWIHRFSYTVIEILATMWWGVALGIVMIGIMGKMPREYFIGMMGRDNSFSGLLRAVFGGVFLDLCCHGILLVAAKLYERGVSLAQVMTFLVASPWNSLSLTMVLVAMIGLKWTLIYILGSIVIALITGLAFQSLARNGYVPPNPNAADMPENFKLGAATMQQFKRIKFSKAGIWEILTSGWADGKMIIKWLLFGTIIAATSRTFIPHEVFADWFGPTLVGLFLTVCIAAIIEICSEGSAPIASEFVTQAGAPGNGFAFLMAGVATDYTEVLAVRQFTGSWKIALLLPLITVPQVVFFAWLMNMAAH
jgi:uncharacterized membrane protein YraQ (UPF0718 family)